ncbi:hypothetical protein AAHE18_13G348400 [Arachis hypogaea]
MRREREVREPAAILMPKVFQESSWSATTAPLKNLPCQDEFSDGALEQHNDELSGVKPRSFRNGYATLWRKRARVLECSSSVRRRLCTGCRGSFPQPSRCNGVGCRTLAGNFNEC